MVRGRFRHTSHCNICIFAVEALFPKWYQPHFYWQCLCQKKRQIIHYQTVSLQKKWKTSSNPVILDSGLSEENKAVKTIISRRVKHFQTRTHVLTSSWPHLQPVDSARWKPLTVQCSLSPSAGAHSLPFSNLPICVPPPRCPRLLSPRYLFADSGVQVLLTCCIQQRLLEHDQSCKPSSLWNILVLTCMITDPLCPLQHYTQSLLQV